MVFELERPIVSGYLKNICFIIEILRETLSSFLYMRGSNNNNDNNYI